MEAGQVLPIPLLRFWEFFSKNCSSSGEADSPHCVSSGEFAVSVLCRNPKAVLVAPNNCMKLASKFLN